MKEIKLITLIATCFIISSCEISLLDCLNPEGADVERIFELNDGITDIVLKIPVDLIVTQGTEQEIRFVGAENILDAIERDSREEGDEYEVDIDGCSDSDGVTMFAQLTSLDKLTISGSASILVEDEFDNLRDLDLLIEGSGNITCNIDEVDELKANIEGSGFIEIFGNLAQKAEHKIEGSGKIDFEYDEATEIIAAIEGSGRITGIGQTSDIDLKIEGSGQLLMQEMLAENGKVAITGSGRIEVAVQNNLEVDIDGSGNVCYVGQPTLELDINGSGTISTCN